MTGPTEIVVRALAFGGKFIGSHVGFARIEIFDGSQLLASGLTDTGVVSGNDGSGDLQQIMGVPYKWGTPIGFTDASYFTANVTIAKPTVLTFVATSQQDERIRTEYRQLVLPNVPLTGNRAVVLVLQGLLVAIAEPGLCTQVQAGQPAALMAQVRMMCGCLIENVYWPADNFQVFAVINGNGLVDHPITLTYNNNPSYFGGRHTFTAIGDYTIHMIAYETNGNSGSSMKMGIKVL
jgi:hypothetical protein